MANSNRVFVSPGVYTSEKDLTFVAQSVGVTTLGLVGETLKGPAFEPILIGSFDEFRTYFGNTSPSKDGNGNPKYELPYFAKSYLQESNQLFITRILGLTGYKPYKSYGIKTLGGVVVDTTSYDTTTDSLDPTSSGITGSTFYPDLSGKTSYDGTSITDYMVYTFSGYTTGETNNWFVIGYVDDMEISGLTGTEVVSPFTGKLNVDNNNGKEWYNTFVSLSGQTVVGVYSYLFVWNGVSFDVTQYLYDATTNNDYDNIVIASLRSRGRYVGETLTLEIENNTNISISNASGFDLSSNPLGEFVVSVTGLTGGAKEYTCSMDTTSTKYITKVLGSEVFDKPYSDYPVYVFESYSNLLKNAFQQGLVRGLSLDLSYNLEGDEFLGEWDTAASPIVVSEVRGGKVSDLFQVVTISDGESSNNLVKIMIQNINLDSGEFDLIVRDFNDTDDNIVVLEKFTRCTMNPELPGYVGRKIGTSDGEYELRSKYIMLTLSDNHPIDAFPAGFKGFTSNDDFSGSTLGSLFYKTKYFTAGDTIYYESDGTPVTSNGDKVRKVSLGLSSQDGFKFDSDLFKFKGKNAGGSSYGFHLSVNAQSITGSTPSGYQFKTTSYDLEGDNKGDLSNINYRKFTFAVAGGFDGWDIYRDVRTYGDGYIFGKNIYVSGHTTNGGVFSSSVGNSDYYSYLKGITTFSNPEAVDINIFSTPGINFFDHSSLVAQAIDMVENDRADSLYIINSPNLTSSSEIVASLDDVAIDSNYSATYWPWIQVRDTDNSTQLYLPPTGEVLKNIALTDNVSYPWFAVAGYSRGLVNSIKAYKKLTLDERDELYKNRINPIATFSDTGTIIWGNKTLQVRESALDRINVRRLLLRARKLISAVAVRLLFEQNDEQVRNEFLRLVNPILESIKKERGLTDFRVTVSNDPEDIDANTLRGKIYIKPTRSLEFIDVEFIITPTGASFENI
jgi:hypothetical protein